MNNPITIQASVTAPIERVWSYWTEPEHIMQWAFASDDWYAQAAPQAILNNFKKHIEQ